MSVPFSILASLAIAFSGADRAGDLVIREIESLKAPVYDRARAKEPNYRQEFLTERGTFVKSRNDLILKLWQSDSEHPKMAEYLALRWKEFEGGEIKDYDEYLKREAEDIASFKKANRRLSPEIKEVVAAAETNVKVDEALNHDRPAGKFVDDFIKAFPKSKQAESMLLNVSYSTTGDDKRKILNKFIQLFPDSPRVSMMKAGLRQLDGVGQPFALSFSDTLSGKPIDIADYQGKVVVIDYWATWCGPCRASMPELKKTYAELKDKGMVVLGISLDYKPSDDAVQKVKEYTSTNGYDWPQYVQGDGWQSQFSAGWGINSIPCTFVVGKDGKLASINPANLKNEVIRLLAK
jgi:thiol-disulfide isomerase/thioredoxin